MTTPMNNEALEDMLATVQLSYQIYGNFQPTPAAQEARRKVEGFIRAALSPQREEDEDFSDVEIPADMMERARLRALAAIDKAKAAQEKETGSSLGSGNGLSGLPQEDHTGKIEIVCIADNFYPAGPTTITVGKTYWGRPREDGYDIINDFGHPAWMLASRFVVKTDRAPKGGE